MNLNSYFHQPIMIDSILHHLAVESSSVVCDMTLGEGGHAVSFLSQLSLEGCFIGIDRHFDILQIAKRRIELMNLKTPCFFRHDNFSNIDRIMFDISKIFLDRVFYDLGISMYHLKNFGTGFSFHDDQSLSMALDFNCSYEAKDVILHFPEKKLADLFWHYGEEKHSRFLAKKIVAYRKKNSILTSKQLADLCLQWLGRKRIHSATKIFQALRIYTNREFEHLAISLFKSIKLLSLGGRIAVLTFHSLEDRLVKKIFAFFTSLYKEDCFFSSLLEQQLTDGIIKKINKKVIKPSFDEIRNNRASRSAKLRVIEKLSHLTVEQWDKAWSLYEKKIFRLIFAF